MTMRKRSGRMLVNRAHKQPARAAALNHEFFRRRVALRDQVFGPRR